MIKVRDWQDAGGILKIRQKNIKKIGVTGGPNKNIEQKLIVAPSSFLTLPRRSNALRYSTASTIKSTRARKDTRAHTGGEAYRGALDEKK